MDNKDFMINYTHRQAGHCESGATSNLFNFYGVNMSEPMAFGIGTGIYFSYLPFIKLMFAPMMSFRNLPNTVFHRSMKYLGVDATVIKKFNNVKESMDALDRNLEKGIPTGCQVGVFNLTFFPPEYRQHYNMHNMVVYGRQGNLYQISDTVMEHPQTLTYEDLVRVRWAKGAFAPKGKMYWINKVPEQLDVKKGVELGIKKSVYEMTKVPFWLIGIKGMRVMARDIRKWPKKHGNNKAAFYLGQILRMAEDYGTGGAGFRYIYGAFLKESGEKFNSKELLEASDIMGRTANKWREFTYLGARNCKNRSSQPVEDYSKLGDMMLEIAGMEEQVYKTIEKARY